MNTNIELTKQLRGLWEQYAIWMRLYIISSVEMLDDLDFVLDRLLENPTDFANVLASFYDYDFAAKFETLFREHIFLAIDLLDAKKEGNLKEVVRIRNEWRNNLSTLAKLMSSINPYLDETEMKKMFDVHLKLTEQEMDYRLQDKYEEDIANFNTIERQVLEMADYMTRGIVKQRNDDMNEAMVLERS